MNSSLVYTHDDNFNRRFNIAGGTDNYLTIRYIMVTFIRQRRQITQINKQNGQVRQT